MSRWKIAIQIASGSGHLHAIDPAGKIIQHELGNIKFPFDVTTAIADALPDQTVKQFDLLLGIPRQTISPIAEEGKAALLLTTIGFAELAKKAFSAGTSSSLAFSQIIEVDEFTDEGGKVVKSPSESYINTVLRQVFNSKPDLIQVVFANAHVGNLHERIFINLLRTAGYKHVYASHEYAHKYSNYS